MFRADKAYNHLHLLSDAAVMTTMNPRVSINTIGQNHWRKVYHGHRYWAGTYKYRGRTYKIRLLLEDHEVSEYLVGNVSAEKARFKVKGKTMVTNNSKLFHHIALVVLNTFCT